MIEESEKAGSHQESNPGYLACAVSALPLSYDNQTTTSPHNPSGGTEVPHAVTHLAANQYVVTADLFTFLYFCLKTSLFQHEARSLITVQVYSIMPLFCNIQCTCQYCSIRSTTHQCLMSTLQCIWSGCHSLHQVCHSGRSLPLHLFCASYVPPSDLCLCRNPTFHPHWEL